MQSRAFSVSKIQYYFLDLIDQRGPNADLHWTHGLKRIPAWTEKGI